MPPGKLSGSCYTVDYVSAGNTYIEGVVGTNVLEVGNSVGYNGTGLADHSCAVGGLYSLSAASALNIDNKIDDGMPYTGNVVAPDMLYGGWYNYSGNPTPGCTDQNNAFPTARYAVTAPVTACELIFRAQF